jgi:hypothetical protein
MKHSLILVALVYSGALTLNAQTPTPHYVVIDDAQAEISLLESRNQEMARSNSVLEDENQNLENEIVSSEEFNVQADEMIDRLSASAGEIYSLMQSLDENETRRELQSRMDDNRQSKYDLENRKRRENEAIIRAGNNIENNRKLISANRIRLKANDQRVAYLHECIDLSVDEDRDIDSVLDNADQVRQEVEQLLNQ